MIRYDSTVDVRLIERWLSTELNVSSLLGMNTPSLIGLGSRGVAWDLQHRRQILDSSAQLLPPPQLLGMKLASSPITDPNIASDGRVRQRHRMTLSCTACRRKKKRCDRKLPCEPCVVRGAQSACIYDSRKFPTTGRWTTSSISNTRKRLNQSSRPLGSPPQCCHPYSVGEHSTTAMSLLKTVVSGVEQSSSISLTIPSAIHWDHMGDLCYNYVRRIPPKSHCELSEAADDTSHHRADYEVAEFRSVEREWRRRKELYKQKVDDDIPQLEDGDEQDSPVYNGAEEEVELPDDQLPYWIPTERARSWPYPPDE